MHYFNLLAVLYTLGFSALLFSRLQARPTYTSSFGGLGLGCYSLGLIAETALTYGFNETWLKLWYFCFPLLALYGHGVLALFISRKLYNILSFSLGLGVLASAALIALTSITPAVDWYDPNLNVQLQYDDMLAYNRPTRFITWLFQSYALSTWLVAVGFSLLGIWRKARAFSSIPGPLSAALGVTLTFGRGAIYTAYGETIFYIAQLIIPILLFWGYWHTFQQYREPHGRLTYKTAGLRAA
jgi:hypothetical protein